MKKVLIITYDMIPHARTWGGCQRMYYLAKQLLKEGYPTKIIALRAEKYNDFGKEVLPDVLFPITKVYNTDTADSKQPSEKKPISILLSKIKSKMVKTIKPLALKLDSFIFNEIQSGNGFKTYLNFRNDKNIIIHTLRSERFDVVICSGPPFNVFRAIPLVKKYCSTAKIIMDYRDPWNFWHTDNPFTKKIEKKYQEVADKIVCTTDTLCEDMSKEFGIERSKFITIANGFPGNPLPKSPHKRDKIIRFIYSGAISIIPEKDAYRDTRALMQAINNVKSKDPDFSFIFVGTQKNNSEYVDKLHSMLGSRIEIYPQVSTEEANQLISKSDVCVLIHTADDPSGRYLVSGKAYDYINARKYIFSISKSDTQHAKLVDKFKIGINVENQSEAIEKGILNCIEYIRTQDEDIYKNIDITQFSRPEQIKKYINLINNI